MAGVESEDSRPAARKLGEALITLSPLAYDAASLLADAIRTAGVSRQVIRKQLAGLRWDRTAKSCASVAARRSRPARRTRLSLPLPLQQLDSPISSTVVGTSADPTRNQSPKASEPQAGLGESTSHVVALHNRSARHA